MKGNYDTDDERAVSPVIGVILMVAITVILAAVIGTFVLNLGGSVQENVQAGASVECNGDGAGGSNGEVTVTWTSNQNADKIQITSATNNGTWSNGDVLNNVGSSTKTTQSGSGEQTVSLTVTAIKGDQSTVISTKECTV